MIEDYIVLNNGTRHVVTFFSILKRAKTVTIYFRDLSVTETAQLLTEENLSDIEYNTVDEGEGHITGYTTVVSISSNETDGTHVTLKQSEANNG